MLRSPDLRELPGSVKVDHTTKEPGRTLAVNSPAHQQQSRAERSRLPLPENFQREDPTKLRQMLEQMKEGQWVEIYTDQCTVRRGKLLFHDQEADFYLFTSRSGGKLMETCFEDLLAKLQQNELRFLETMSFWDRSLNHVLDYLSASWQPAELTPHV